MPFGEHSIKPNHLKKKKKSYQIGERMSEVLVEIPKTEPRKERKRQIALQVNEEWKTLSYIGSL